MTTTDGWLQLSCASHVTRKTRSLGALENKHIYLHTRALSGQHPDPCALSALDPFFGNFSAARPRLVARLAPRDSPHPRGPCPRAGPPLAAAVRTALARWQGRVSAVSHTRPNHSPVSLRRPVCRGPRTVPRSRSFFLVSFWYDTNGRYIYLQGRPMSVSYVSRNLQS